MLQDLRYALRGLAGAPSFAVPALLTLALGIGSNTAVLSVVNAVVVRPLPGIEHQDRLAWIEAVDQPSGHSLGLRRDEIDAIEALGRFERVAASSAAELNLASGAGVERAEARFVTAGFFQTLGVAAAHGRLFGEADVPTAASDPVAVISWNFWQRRFGGDPGVLGTPLMLNGRAFTVAGITARGFVGTELADRPPDLWAMSAGTRARASADGFALDGTAAFEVIVRLRPGDTREQAAPALDVLAARLRSARGAGRSLSLRLAPLTGGVRPADLGDAVPAALVGFAVTGAVLLIACANVAGLLLARASRREREMGIRVALGATRARLVRQVLTESLVLATVAGAVAVPFAWWGVGAMSRAVALPLPLDLRPDRTVLAGTLLVAVLSAFAFGLAPALGIGRAGVAARLAGATVAGISRLRARRQRYLVAAQVALSIALLATAGVLLQHLRELAGADARTAATERLIVASFDLAGQGYSPARQRAFGRDLLARLERVAGVESASLASLVPLGRTRIAMSVEAEGTTSGSRQPPVSSNWVSPEFFRTLGTPIVRGRGFTAADETANPTVAVVNETMARLFWPGSDAVGRQLRSGGRPTVTVVGIVADSRFDAGANPRSPSVFLPGATQLGPRIPAGLLVRARGDAAGLLPIVRSIVSQMDPALPVFDAQTMEGLLARRRAPKRAAAVVLSVFGALALVLTAIGIYGVMAYAVERRTREIGVRVAIGAGAPDVVLLLLREGAAPAAAGVTIGVLLAAIATAAFASFAGIPRAGASLLAGVSAVILLALLMACWIPARRALRVDPAVTLRLD